MLVTVGRERVPISQQTDAVCFDNWTRASMTNGRLPAHLDERNIWSRAVIKCQPFCAETSNFETFFIIFCLFQTKLRCGTEIQ